MPSHKHKKKKKSRKHSKKSLSTLSSDSECSSWNVRYINSDSDDSKDEEILTSLVREIYLKHLQQALTENYEGWTKDANELTEDSLKMVVKKWSSALEHRSIRACMMTELYRKKMVSLIRQIKASTTCGKLYTKEDNVIKLLKRIPLSKQTQTDKMNDCQEMCVAETQTDPSCYSFLELPLPKNLKLSPTTRPYDPAIEFSDSYSSDTAVSSSLNAKQFESSNVICLNQDACNISSTSDLIDSHEISLNKLRRNEIKVIEDSFSASSPKLSTDNQCQSLNRNSKPETYANVEFYDEDYSDARKTLPVNVSHSINLKKDNLDARLTAMGLLSDFENESENISQMQLEKPKKSNWYAEEIAQSCNFTRILSKMSTKQREQVMKQITELFGEKHEPLTELTESNIAVCRKRIASVVVMELTPMYQAKRIASRHLFKFLAKKITKILMDQSYAPDTKSIRWKVKEFFSDGKLILSESDCV